MVHSYELSGASFIKFSKFFFFFICKQIKTNVHKNVQFTKNYNNQIKMILISYPQDSIRAAQRYKATFSEANKFHFWPSFTRCLIKKRFNSSSLTNLCFYLNSKGIKSSINKNLWLSTTSLELILFSNLFVFLWQPELLKYITIV